jgi:O-antigen/teichoic acid export membrane protein
VSYSRRFEPSIKWRTALFWRARVGAWARLASDYIVAQGLIQGLALGSGLMLVNIIPVREYALYALALSILSFVSVFSDLGISSALMYFRRETNVARTAFEPYVAAALRLRRALMAVGLGAASWFFVWAALNQGFAVQEILMVLAGIAVTLWYQIQASLNLLRLRLAAAYRPAYIAEAAGNAGRLAGAVGMWLTAATFAAVAMVVGALGAVLTARFSRRSIALIPLESGYAPDADTKIYTRGLVRYLIPTASSGMYFAIQAPLTIWLASYFGQTENIAQVGALGRLALVFGIFSGFMGTVVFPRLSAITDERQYLRRYLVCWGALIPLGLAIAGLAQLAPHGFLWLLGSSYAGLEREVGLVALTSAVVMWGGFAVGVTNARGWVRWQSAVLVLYVLAQVLLVMQLDLSSTHGVILFGLWSAVAGLALQLVVNVIGFYCPGYVAVRSPKRSRSIQTDGSM